LLFNHLVVVLHSSALFELHQAFFILAARLSMWRSVLPTVGFVLVNPIFSAASVWFDCIDLVANILYHPVNRW